MKVAAIMCTDHLRDKDSVANRSVKPVKCFEVDEEVVCPNCCMHFNDWYGYQIHRDEVHGSAELVSLILELLKNMCTGSMAVFGDVSRSISSPPEKKGRQMGKYRQKEVNLLVILIKQVLKQSRMQALLQSAILECFIISKDFPLTKDLMQTKQDYVDAQKISSTEEKHKMAQMHIRVWDMWVEVVLSRMERGAAIQDADPSMCLGAVAALKDYQQWIETVGLVGVCDEVKVIHIGRAWGTEKKKLFFHCVPSTQTH